MQDEFGTSEQKKWASGIRQECPLSPYWFVVVMTSIEKDIASEISQHVRENRIPGTNFDMVFYADDTIVISRCKAACEELIEK